MNLDIHFNFVNPDQQLWESRKDDNTSFLIESEASIWHELKV